MNKKILIFGFLTFSFVTVLLTLYNLKFRTEVKSHAQKSTSLAFVSPTGAINGGNNFNIDMTLTPGTNLVDYIQLVIAYDSTKLQPGNPAIVPNTAIFPDQTKNILQGSTQDSCTGSACTESIILSIGFSPSAALQGTNPITIGHINFTALQPTDSSGTQVSFDPSTLVYSLASSDQLTENVLATANPVTIVIGGQAVTGIPTPVPTQTNTGNILIQNLQFTPNQLTVSQGTTVTWTNQEQTIVHTTTSDSQNAAEVWDSGNISPGQSFSHIFNTPGTYTYHCKIHPAMTGTIIVLTNTQVTPTPPLTGSGTPAGPPTGSITVHFEAIDKNNNVHPNHPQRQLELDFYKSNNFGNKPDFTTNILVTHIAGDASGNFINDSFDLSSIPQGSYYILVKSPEGSLREQVSPQLIQLGPGLNTLPPVPSGNQNSANTPVAVELRMGDIDNNNNVDIKDYNIIVDCFGRKERSGSCTQHKVSDSVKGLFADLDDDGSVDGVDYNLVVRHLGEVGY